MRQANARKDVPAFSSSYVSSMVVAGVQTLDLPPPTIPPGQKVQFDSITADYYGILSNQGGSIGDIRVSMKAGTWFVAILSGTFQNNTGAGASGFSSIRLTRSGVTTLLSAQTLPFFTGAGNVSGSYSFGWFGDLRDGDVIENYLCCTASAIVIGAGAGNLGYGMVFYRYNA